MGNSAVTTASLLLSTLFIVLPSSSVGTCPVNVSEPMTWLLMEGGYYGLSNNHVTSVGGARCLCTSWTQTRLALQDAAFDLEAVAGYLTKHHLSDKFWVDAARSSDSGSYLWADGCPLSPDSSLWGEEVLGPGGADCVVLSSGTRDKMALSAAACDNTSARALCQTVIPPDIFTQVPSGVNFTWVTLGSPGQQYGFSHTKMYFSAARQTCAGLPGVARLASLDTHFQDVVQYIFHNYPDRQFWVDCTRVDKRSPFSWGNGAWVNDSFWAPQEPGPYDLLARLTIKTHDVRLAGMSGQEKDCFVVCERTQGPSAVTLEWTALGSPLRNFGFSNWSTDFLSARQTCAQQVGNVSLASLRGGVEGLHGYLQQVFPQRQFWVDATRSGSTFEWGDGSSVDSLWWGDNEPQLAHDGAVVTVEQGEIRLAGQLQTSEYFFLCEGSPGLHPDPSQATQFPTGCSRSEDVVTMETSVFSSPVVSEHPSQTENLLELVTSSVTMAETSRAVTLPTPSVSPPSSLTPTAVTWDLSPEMTSHPPDLGSRFTVTAEYGDSSVSRPRPVTMSAAIHLSVSDAQQSVLPSPTSSDARYSVLSSLSSFDFESSRQHARWGEAGGPLFSRSSGLALTLSDPLLTSEDRSKVQSGDILSGLRTSRVDEPVSDYGSRSIDTSSSTSCSSWVASDHRSLLTATEASLNGDFLTNSLKKDSHDPMTSWLAATPPLRLASATVDDGNGRPSSTSQNVVDTSSGTLAAPSSSLSTTSNSVSEVATGGGQQAAPETRCQCVLLQAVLTVPLDYKTEAIKQELLLDHRNLSATIRRLTSAQDWRPSCVVSGLAAILALSVVAALIIAPDLHGLVRTLVARR